MKKLFIFLILIIILTSCRSQENIIKQEEDSPMYKKQRKPAVAGQFYPSEEEELTTQIENFLSDVKKQKFEDRIKAIIVPHAGYVYSGLVAAYAYKKIEGEDIDK